MARAENRALLASGDSGWLTYLNILFIPQECQDPGKFITAPIGLIGCAAPQVSEFAKTAIVVEHGEKERALAGSVGTLASGWHKLAGRRLYKVTYPN
jgi:hypothetical protein